MHASTNVVDAPILLKKSAPGAMRVVEQLERRRRLYIIHKLSILLGCQDAIEGGQHVTPLSPV